MPQSASTALYRCFSRKLCLETDRLISIRLDRVLPLAMRVDTYLCENQF